MMMFVLVSCKAVSVVAVLRGLIDAIQPIKMKSKPTLLLLFLLIGMMNCFAQPLALSDLEGKWYILQTDFPMWLSGKRTAPTFNYQLLDGKQVLQDKVLFMKNNKEKSIQGVDYPANSDNTAFVWRGKGLLRLLKSKWEIVYMNPGMQWAIIYFEKTLFTPRGFDVIARQKQITKDQQQLIEDKLMELHIMGLQPID